MCLFIISIDGIIINNIELNAISEKTVCKLSTLNRYNKDEVDIKLIIKK